MSQSLTRRLDELQSKGVHLVDPRQVYIADDVDLNRIMHGSILHPGTRLLGARTLIAKGAQVGTEGPTTLLQSVLGSNVEIASGYLDGTVMLSGSRAGANSHFRSGTLIEEGASTAHAVGLKQTILMCFATTGSLINLCDALVSGGRSRLDHTEIGSGFIHFNFTPWGAYGDKATPSLIGNVTSGVFLDQDRIFLGGLSGLVGPSSVGFGSLTAAGQVIRKSVEGGKLFSQPALRKSQDWKFGDLGNIKKVVEKNIHYMGQLAALWSWYSDVRRPGVEYRQTSTFADIITINEAINNIEACINERSERLNKVLQEHGLPTLDGVLKQALRLPPPELSFEVKGDHIDWIRHINPSSKTQLKEWLELIASETEDRLSRSLTL